MELESLKGRGIDALPNFKWWYKANNLMLMGDILHYYIGK